ncbi:MAG TPA: TauD/TfdA family dioxygenase [Novosphingobium sp.]|nr:TauD/TfdA family dioxygenase [Novosphingobium sp.]
MAQSTMRAINPDDDLESLRFEPVTGCIGADVVGLDMSTPLSPKLFAAISDALVKYKVLFFRDQDITPEQHIAFARPFGELDINPFAKNPGFQTDANYPEIVVIESTKDKFVAADTWHSDLSYKECPPLGSVLRCRITPKAGGDTVWADMAAAFEDLDDSTRSLITGLTALHDSSAFEPGLRANGADEAAILERRRNNPAVEHPLVRTHPTSGEKILYVNGLFTKGIKGMKESESRPLLERLFRQVANPDYQVRFRWRVNSIAFWDNRSTQHRANRDFFPHHRRMDRVTILGDRPF